MRRQRQRMRCALTAPRSRSERAASRRPTGESVRELRRAEGSLIQLRKTGCKTRSTSPRKPCVGDEADSAAATDCDRVLAATTGADGWRKWRLPVDGLAAACRRKGARSRGGRAPWWGRGSFSARGADACDALVCARLGRISAPVRANQPPPMVSVTAARRSRRFASHAWGLGPVRRLSDWMIGGLPSAGGRLAHARPHPSVDRTAAFPLRAR